MFLLILLQSNIEYMMFLQLLNPPFINSLCVDLNRAKSYCCTKDINGVKKNGKHLARRVSKMHTTHGIIGSDAHQNPKKKSGHLSKATDRNNPEYAIGVILVTPFSVSFRLRPR